MVYARWKPRDRAHRFVSGTCLCARLTAQDLRLRESGAAREINHDARISVEYRKQRNKVRVDWDSEEF